MGESVGEGDGGMVDGVSVFQRLSGDLENGHVGFVVLVQKVEEELGGFDTPQDLVQNDTGIGALSVSASSAHGGVAYRVFGLSSSLWSLSSIDDFLSDLLDEALGSDFGEVKSYLIRLEQLVLLQ